MVSDSSRDVFVIQRSLIAVGILIFLLSSFVILLFFIDAEFVFNGPETWWAFKNSVLQSFISAFFTLLLGFIVALGLMKIPERNFIASSFATLLCLVPQFVPVVISLVGIMSSLQPFPMGIPGIILVHVFLNFGLAAILMQNQIKALWGETADVSRTLGVSRWRYLRYVGLPQLKLDFLLMFVFFFSVFFSSFSVPLIVGGGRGTTLEVLIYEKMRLSSDWSAATYLGMIQASFILLLSVVTWRSRVKTVHRQAGLQWLGAYWGLIPLVLIMAWFFAGYSSGLIEGLRQVANLRPFKMDLVWGSLSSLGLAGITFVFLLYAFKLLAYLQVVPSFLDRFLNGYVAPSTALACFGILILLPAGDVWSFLKIPVAFLMLTLPSVYRLGWGEKLKRLNGQIMMARTFGAGSKQILNHIVWPQIKSDSRFLSALVATWVCGDFAVSRILSNKDFSLGLILESLLSSYRMSLASVVSVILIFLCVLIFFVIVVWSYVDRRNAKN